MSVGSGNSQPIWSRGTLLLFAGVVVALVIFVATLALIVGRPERETGTEAPRNVFQDFNVELGDRGAVDLQSKSLTVSLKFSGLPADEARRMSVKVSIDGRDAQVSESGDGRGVTASAVLEEKVENIVKSHGVGAVLLVKGSCEYGGESKPFDVSATRLQVVSKSEKELGLAFANFPEPTPRPVPRVKPTPTPVVITPPPTPEQAPRLNKPSSPTPEMRAPVPESTPSTDVSRMVRLRKEIEREKSRLAELAARMSKADKASPEYQKLRKMFDQSSKKLAAKMRQMNRPE